MRKTIALCLCCLTLPIVAGANPTRVGSYSLPTRLAESLRQGLTVALYLNYLEQLNTDTAQKQKIADATIIMKDGLLFIENIDFSEVITETELSENTKNKLNALKTKPFNDQMQLQVSEDAELQLDLQSLNLQLHVQKSALGTRRLVRTDVLNQSTVNTPSSVLNYRFGSYYNTNGSEDNASSYLSLSSLSALGEHHLALNGSIYGIGTSAQYSDLYRAVYERDFEGRRFAIGLMDTWSMQSIASFNAINSSKIYGASYGNQSQTIIQDRSLSLTPIILFLPNAATVQVYRDGRLISIQNLPMGSQELDTSTFPYGVYNVDIKTFINGQEFSSSTAQVNKSRGRNSTDTTRIEWQFFGGMVEYRPLRPEHRIRTADHRRIQQPQDQETWLMGGAVAKNFNWLSGVTLKSTLYGFADTAVTELDGIFHFAPSTNLSLQTMFASDLSLRTISTLNYMLPKNIGNFWLSYDFSQVGKALNIDEQNNVSVGSTLNLTNFSSKLGQVTASYSHDRENDNSHTNVEYSQHVYDSRYIDVRFRIGAHNYDFHVQDQQDDRYIFIDVSLPIARWFSAGLSSRNRNIMADLSFKQHFKEHFISDLGLNISHAINPKQEYRSNDQDHLSLNGYLGYETKYNEGSFSAGVTGRNQSINYLSQGSLAWVGQHLAFSHLNQDSGLMIHTDLADQGNMSALINGQSYRLSGKRNFIPLQPYRSYNIELTNAKNAMDSVNIINGRKNSAVLYPGNIAIIAPSIQQTVTVFGRLHDATGQVIARQEIRSEMSKAQSDEHGEFSIDVDKRHPRLSVHFKNGTQCETTVNIKQARGAVWLGDLTCQNSAVAARHRPEGGK